MSKIPGLGQKEAEMSQINSLLDELNVYKQDRRDQRVEAGRGLLKSELQPYALSASENSIIFLLHGSMIFHDGIKNDADLLVFGPSHSVTQQWYLENISELEYSTKEKWQTIFPGAGHDFIYYSLDRLMERNRGYEDMQANSAAIILSGDLLFPQHAVWQTIYQQIVLSELLDKKDWLRSELVKELKFNVAERKARRRF